MQSTTQTETAPVNNVGVSVTGNDEMIDLSGMWLGDYGRNGIEIVEVHYVNNHFVGYKVTGDESIPCGKISFYLPDASQLTMKRRSVDGFIQIAHRQYTSPRYVPGKIHVVDNNSFSFEWSTTLRKFTRVNSQEAFSSSESSMDDAECDHYSMSL